MSDIPERLVSALADRYRLERELGQGGMATVYLAEDLKHDRRVAIKVLKPELAAMVGGDRFVSEIKTTANLQHPHILPLFDSGEADGFLFYVMPYVEGETLRDRIDRDGQLPTDEALALATKIGGALSAAHAHGIVHRDVKPANILLANGEPLVADFGIALAVDAGGGQRLTETGLSLGTPYYMSPEQATGEANVGPAADQYALAAVLYEMLVGDPPFVGGNAQAVLGKIIQGAPTRPREVRRAIPRNVDGAVMRGLERLPADRFGSVRVMVDALTTASFRYGDDTTAGTQRSSKLLVMGLAATSMLFAAVAGWALTQGEDPRGTHRWYVQFAEGQEPAPQIGRRRYALSPDGERLVYVGPAAVPSDLVRTSLWVRELGRLEATPIPGTDNAESPAFSRDGTRLVFVVHDAGGSQLRVGPHEGGPFVLLTDSLVDRGGATFGADGFIYYDGHLEGDGLARIPAAGPGRPEPATMPGPAERYHTSPIALPGGRGVLFYAAGVDSIGVVDTDTGQHRFLTDGLAAEYAASGHLLWVRPDGTLMAQAFDEDRLELSGSAEALAENVRTWQWGGWNGSIARDGTLLHTVGDGEERMYTLNWLLPDGEREAFSPDWQRAIGNFALDRVSGRVAFSAEDPDEGVHVWVAAADGSPPRRVTANGRHRYVGWTDDGEHVVYLSQRDSGGVLDLVVRDPDTAGQGEVVLPSATSLPTGGWTLSPGSEWVVIADREEPYALRLDPDLRPTGERIELDFNPSAGNRPAFVRPVISPDGQWLAYWSEVSGTPRVEVRPFPNVHDGVWPVSDGTAATPRWSPDGAHLYFFDLDRHGLARVSVSGVGVLTIGTPEIVTSLHEELDGQSDFAIDASGRILLREQVGRADRTVLVTDLFSDLRARAPAARR